MIRISYTEVNLQILLLTVGAQGKIFHMKTVRMFGEYHPHLGSKGIPPLKQEKLKEPIVAGPPILANNNNGV